MEKGEAIAFLAMIDDPEVLAAAVDAAKKKQLEGTEKEKRTYKLKKGLSLFYNGASKSLWVRVALPGGDARKSTGCSDLELAKQQAFVIEAEVLANHKSGSLDVHKHKKWTILCYEVVKELKAKHKKLYAETGNRRSQPGTHASIIENKLANREDWKDKAIYQIGYPELCDLAESELFTNLSKTVVSNLKRSINLVFESARRKGLITREQVPELPDFNPRDSEEGYPFDIDDREVLLSNLVSFYESSRTNKITRHVRRQFPMYFNLLMCTGLRTGAEPLGIMWSNIVLGKFELKGRTLKAYSVTITKGKMAKETVKNKKKISLSRKILINADAVKTLEQLYYVKYGIRKTMEEIVKEKKNDLIFTGYSGNIPDFASTFNQYQDYLKGKLKEEYTLYCARHEFINRELDRGMSEQDVADQCGNSPATIHSYYKKYEAMNRAGRILTEEDILAFNPEIVKDA